MTAEGHKLPPVIFGSAIPALITIDGKNRRGEGNSAMTTDRPENWILESVEGKKT